MSSISQTAASSGPSRATRSARIAGSVVPGRTRQSTSIVASPGMTLYLMPECTTSGLTVSRTSARRARAYIGSQATAIAASARPGSSPDSPSRMRAASAGSSAAASRRKRAMTGVRRVGPGLARRSMTAAARTAALSSRGIEPWPDVPRTAIR